MKPDWHSQLQTDSCNTHRQRGGLQRDVRDCVNPHGVAFPLWIFVRLNFSMGRMAKSDRPLCKCHWIRTVWVSAALCHRLPLTPFSSIAILLFFVSVWVLFAFSFTFPSAVFSPALSHAFIIVFYLCLAIACRKIAHPVRDVSCFFSPFWFPFLIFAGSRSTLATSLFHITQLLLKYGYSALFLCNLLAYL